MESHYLLHHRLPGINLMIELYFQISKNFTYFSSIFFKFFKFEI